MRATFFSNSKVIINCRISKISKGEECQNQGERLDKEEAAADNYTRKQKSDFKALVNAKQQKTLLANLLSVLRESLIHKTWAADKEKDATHVVCRQLLH